MKGGGLIQDNDALAKLSAGKLVMFALEIDSKSSATYGVDYKLDSVS